MYSIILLQLYYLMLNGFIIFQEYNTIKQIYKSTASPVAPWCKNLPATQETQEMRVRSLGQEDPLEEEIATHSSILTWKIPWTEEPGRLKSMGHKESDRTKRLSTVLIFLGETVLKTVMKIWKYYCDCLLAQDLKLPERWILNLYLVAGLGQRSEISSLKEDE